MFHGLTAVNECVMLYGWCVYVSMRLCFQMRAYTSLQLDINVL